MKFPKLRHAGLCQYPDLSPGAVPVFCHRLQYPAGKLGHAEVGPCPEFPAAGVEALQPGIPHGPGEIRMGEYALYCGLGDRVAVLTYTKQEGKKHLLLEKDLAAYGTSGKSRTRRRRITPEEQKSCRARLESWLVAEGYRFEAETEK